MKVKGPSSKVTVVLEPDEAEDLVKAAGEIEKAYARQSADNRAYFQTHGQWPRDFGPISGDTLTLLLDLAKALEES